MGFYVPDWPIPSNVRSLITTRIDGASLSPFDAFNIASHVGDDTSCVNANREVLKARLGARYLSWLTQVHGTEVASLPCTDAIEADAVTTNVSREFCIVSTADCIPILLCDQSGHRVSAVHAGWRGLAAGIVTNAIRQFECKPENILVYVGPCISQSHFEVGGDVLDIFSNAWSQSAIKADVFSFFELNSQKDGKYLADLVGLLKAELRSLGINTIYGGDRCTWRENDLFFSYRKDGATGRFASIIWRDT